MNNKELRIYRTSEGKEPFTEWLDSDKKTQSKDIEKAKNYLEDFWRRYHG